MSDRISFLDELGASDLRSVLDQLLVLLWDPTANLTAALLLYGIIGLLILIIVAIVFMLILAGPEDEMVEGGRPATVRGPSEVSPGHEETSPAARASALMTGGIVLLVFVAAWVATGYSTAQSVVCTGCHVSTPHEVAEEVGDPHAATGCVRCHEPGGVFGRYVTNVPFRMTHFLDGAITPAVQAEYGRVTQGACLACHSEGISETTLNQARGLLMSHQEPLEASATCLDCHTMQDGVIGVHNAGMNPCLRCHNSVVASAECSTCHERQAAAAARARTTSFASVQVDEVRCGGCHDERRQCDPCHGVRLPHEREFMMYAHARAAAVDMWFGDGSTCAGSECHTPTRRSCQRCHGQLLGVGHGAGLAGWHQDSTHFSCNRCHQRWAFSPQRDFCEDVCHSEAAMRYSPR